MTRLVGNQTSTGTVSYSSARQPKAEPFVATSSGTATHLGIKAGFAASCRLAVYSNVASAPNTLLGYTNVFTTNNGTETLSSLVANFTVVSGTTYWLVVILDSTSASAVYQDGGATAVSQRIGTTLATIGTVPPTTWSNVTGASAQPFHVWVESLGTTISSIDKLAEGETSTITTASSVSTFTQAVLTDSVGQTKTITSSLSGAGTSWTFPCTAIADGVAGLKLGTIGVVATFDGVATPSYSSVSYSKTGYTYVDIASVSLDAMVLTPAIAIGDQLAYVSSTATIYNDGRFESDYTGTQTVWHYCTADFKWRSYSVVTVGGTVVGITRSGLTLSGLTAVGLTSSGLQ